MKPIALPDLLVEYLVTGALALLWLLPLLDVGAAGELETLPTAILVALAPGLYALGMAVDFVAFSVISLPRGVPGIPSNAWNIKRVVRRFAERGRLRGDREGSIARSVRLRFDAPEIASEIAMRSSRDRVARGAWMNLLLTGATLAWAPTPAAAAAPAAAMWLAFAGAALCFVMWAFFEANSFVYELRVIEALNQRRETEIAAGSSAREEF